MLRALCLSGKPCACDACDACGGWTGGVKVAGGGGGTPASHDFTFTGEASLGGGGGGGSLTADAEAIFLNFLWRYFPSDSSQRCSTGSMAGTLGKGEKRSSKQLSSLWPNAKGCGQNKLLRVCLSLSTYRCRTFGGEGGCRGGDAALFLDEDDMAAVGGGGDGGEGLEDLLPALLLPPPPSWLRLERVAEDDW